jgi:flagellar hook-associated protein 1 FlgK
MAGDLLNIGKTGLFAAQVGMSTTGHNITNANVVGYTRQAVVQTTMPAQNAGFGFIGSGTQVAEIKRYSDDFLNAQVRSAQTSSSGLNAFYAQISQVDNMLADTTSGLSPALQDFFKGVQDVSSNPASAPSRQALLSSAESLASRFQSINGRLGEIREGLNSQVTANVTVINSYAQQIAQLNDDIAGYSSNPQIQPNDLLDKRDQLVAELNMQVKTSVVKGDNNSLTISIGNGQPLVVGNKQYQLAVTTSATDISRLQVGIVAGPKIVPLAENAFSGGELGGLMEFRANVLDRAQNELGRVAIGLAQSFNDQHRLGQDQSDVAGGDFFTVGSPLITKNRNNNLASTTQVTAVISDVSKLTSSDYKLGFDGTNYSLTRLSDNKAIPFTPPQTVDGIDFDVSGLSAPGDNFTIRPTIAGAAGFGVAISDVTKIAAAAPIRTVAPLTNTGTGKISEGVVDASYLSTTSALPVTLSFDKATGELAGFPAAQAVKVTDPSGNVTSYAAGATPVLFSAGATYQFGGISVTLSGTPADADTFTVERNIGGTGDNRNARLLGSLQARPILDNGSATYQSSYAQLVSFVGNKTREAQVSGQAADAMLAQAKLAQQNVSGVNLDEEAANLLKYQQAYQAAGKVMQIAGTLFDTLLSLGH